MSFLGPVLGIASAVGGLFGKGDKPAGSNNQAFGQLQQTYTPQTQTGVGANNFMAGLLGVPGGDTAGSDAGLQHYLDLTGYAPALERMQRGVVGGQAARGLLNSGSTSRRLLEEGAKINQGYGQNYFQNLNTLSGRGLDAGQLIGSAGQQSSGAQPGFSRLGNAMSAIGPGVQAGNAVVKSIGSIFS